MLKTLKASRQEVDLSQKEVAAMLNISPCYLSSIENLRRKSATVEAEVWRIINERREELQRQENQDTDSENPNDKE